LHGTSEWANLKTETERFEALQIPPELLKTMSTENLIITCLNYSAFRQKRNENAAMERFLQTGELQNMSLFNDLIEMGTHFINAK